MLGCHSGGIPFIYSGSICREPTDGLAPQEAPGISAHGHHVGLRALAKVPLGPRIGSGKTQRMCCLFGWKVWVGGRAEASQASLVWPRGWT